MSQLPLDLSIPRFKTNEERFRDFVNGSETDTFLTDDNTEVPSLRKFVADKNEEINEAADGLLATVTTKTQQAIDAAAAAAESANEAALFDPSSYYIKSQIDTMLSSKADSIDLQKAVPAGAVVAFSRTTAPEGWLKANGPAVLRSAYSALDAAIYVGDALNASALSGYRCTNPASPSTTRSTTGAYIVIPDLRAEIIRGLDDGRGIDAGRVINSAQADQNKAHIHTGTAASDGAHTHTASTNSTGAHTHTYTAGGAQSVNNVDTSQGVKQNFAGAASNTGSSGAHSHTVTVNSDGAHTHSLNIASDGGAEARMRNVAMLYCIKY